MRLVALSMDRSFDLVGTGKNRGLLQALAARHEVVAALHPEVGALEALVRKAAAFQPDRELWRRRWNLDPGLFAARSRAAGIALDALAGRFDQVVQLHTLVGPGLKPGRFPYVLHTDATYRLTERWHPEGAPLSGRTRARWLAYESEVFRSAQWLFPRSSWLARSFVDDYGCDPARVVRVGGGVNHAGPRDRSWDAPVAVFVGLEFQRKGGPALLDAFERVRRRVRGARLIVVGTTGPPRDGVEWRGPTDHAGVARAYAEASVFVMPSRFEPWGHVFLEAMGHGLPCVGTTRCAMPEIIEHGRTGLLVPPDAPAALADALALLLGDRSLRERFGRAAWQAAAPQTWEAVVDRMAPAFVSCSGRPR